MPELGWKGLGLGGPRRRGVVQRCHHAYAFIHRLHIWVSSRGNSDRQRAIHAANHRDDIAARQRHPLSAGIFVFTLIFSVKAAGRMGTSVQQLVAFITANLGLICIVAFLYLIDHAAKMLRPVSLVNRIAENGLAVIESLYPEQFTEVQSITPLQKSLGATERTILHRGKAAIVIAVNVKNLSPRPKKRMV